MLTQEILKELVSYDKDSGILIWRHRGRHLFGSDRCMKAWNTRLAGNIIRNLDKYGYLRVSLYGKTWMAHRLIWFHVHGELPSDEIDHINGIRDDNRISNLRVASRSENMRNKAISKRNKLGVQNVWLNKKSRKWQVYINCEYLGSFKDKFEAICVRKSAENKYEYHENHGRI